MKMGDTGNSFLRNQIILCCMILFLMSWGLPNAGAQEGSGAAQPLFSQPVDTKQADPSVVRDKQVKRFAKVGINLSLIESAAAIPADRSAGHDASFSLNLFNDVTYVADLIRSEKTANGLIWIGRLRGVEMSQVVLSLTNGILSGNITMPSARYHIRYAGGGAYEVQEIDTSKYPLDHPETPLIPPISPDAVSSQEHTQGDSCSQIDIMIVYTATARAAAGGTSAMQSLIDLAVAETNQSYLNSGITQRLRLVHSVEVVYSETGSLNDALNCITDNADGCLDTIHSLRDTYKADLVSFWLEDGGSYCGLAWLMATVSPSFESYGFSTVARSCATGYYSFGHEFGHNMGARHDVFVDNNSTPYAYAHGFTHPQPESPWRTVMAYNNACSSVGLNCTRLQYWSNPAVSIGGAPMGDATADNHQTLNNTACTVANFRVAGTGYTLSGVVRSGSSTGPVLAGATVSIAGKTATTDSAGAFSIAGIASGTYTLTISRTGFSPYSNSAYAMNADKTGQTFYLAPLVTLTANGASPQSVGNKITFTATAGGGGTYQYQFRLRNPAGSWSVAQGYGTASSWTWDTAGVAVGNWVIEVWVRNAGSTAPWEAYKTMNYRLVPRTTAVTLTSSAASPQSVGNKIVFTSVASGGSGTYEYQFRLRNPSAVWSVARAYGTTTSWTWNTAGLAVGNWVIEVWARNVGSTAAWEAFKTMSYTLRSPVSAVSLSANKTSPQARGTSIIFTAAATGTSGSYVYQYRLRTPSGVWSVARDYSSTPTWTWNTTVGQAAGSYQIEVWAKNTGSNASQEAYKKISFTLQ